MKKILKWVAIVFVGIVVIAIFAGGSSDKKEKSNEEQAVKPEVPMESVTAQDIAKAYDENTVAADLRFKGKKFKVTGTVSDINTDFMGDPYVTLRGANQFTAPHFAFDKDNASVLAKLKKGEKITLVCTGKGDVAKTPMSGDCALQ